MQLTLPQLQVVRDAIRTKATHIFNPLATSLGKMGISPNHLTFLGFLLSIGVGIILAEGQFFWGGILLIFTSLFDGLDGLVARASGKVGKFGAHLDSSLDRYSEGVVFLGLLIFYSKADSVLDTVLIFVALLASLMVSYTKARAEGLGLECKVGLLSRLERLVILILGLTLNQVRLALWAIAILANLTAIQRMIHVWQQTEKQQGKSN